MSKTKHSKRENFEVSPEQQAEIETLQELIHAPSKKDALLLAVQVTLHLATEMKKGKQLFVGHSGQNDLQRFIMVGIEKPNCQKWMYLVEQAHAWKRQLYVKGRKLPAAVVWTSMMANTMTVEQAADNWDLPVDAVYEIIEYCETSRTLLEMEAAEELRLAEERGIQLVPKIDPR